MIRRLIFGKSMLRRYIHIGFPKCASTTLQYQYFREHQQIDHLGIGCQGPGKIGMFEYASEDIQYAVEIALRYERDFLYDKARHKKAFQNQFKNARKNRNIKAVGISSESLSFTLLGDIDPTQKAKRLFDIFGKGTKVLMVIRDQRTLLESLYCELIKGLSQITS